MEQPKALDEEARKVREIEPLFHPCNRLEASAPLRWLRLGWQDLRRAPRLSLTYGFVVTGLCFLMTWLAWGESNSMALFTIGIGIILLGPALAFGPYSISRQLAKGLVPQFGYCIRESGGQMRNELLFALILLVIFLVWARAASMVHIFFPIAGDTGVMEWVQFLAVGSAVGALFAGLVFVASAFSLPMMLDRNTDAITSALTSVNAVKNNIPAMIVWAGLIVGLVLVGFATAFIGLAVILPWIGHATWHAYKETIRDAEKIKVYD
ncbi:MAG: DUF2189 domain-containing protein [Gammaproteobacteria bacterium]|jgi:uncharacterized membrane protein